MRGRQPWRGSGYRFTTPFAIFGFPRVSSSQRGSMHHPGPELLHGRCKEGSERGSAENSQIAGPWPPQNDWMVSFNLMSWFVMIDLNILASLTCRRRHLKCDESTPACGRCIKSQQVCTYVRDAMVHRYAADNTENSQTDAVTTDRDDQSPCSRHSPSSRDPSPPESDSWQPNYTDQDCEQAAGSLLLLNPGASSTSYPAEDTIFPPTSISYTQPGFAARSEASFHVALTPPDVAFHRWFDLLANDVAQEGTLWRSLMNSPESTSQTIPLVSPQQSAANNPPAEAGPPPNNNLLADSAPSSLETPQTPLTARISWRGSEPAKLSDHEHFLFENFVNNVSGWVNACSLNFTLVTLFANTLIYID